MNPRLKWQGSLSAAVVLLMTAVGWLMIQTPTLQAKVDAGDQRIGQLEKQGAVLEGNQQKLLKGMDEANRRLVANGQRPVPVPSVTPSPAPSGLTAPEVRLIVLQELADQKITITQSEVSQIARTVDTLKASMPTQIATSVKLVVAAYCSGDRCLGKPGTPGPKGDRGEDAPKVTDEQLLAAAKQALLSYCGQETQPCKGEPGATGSTGPQGDPGRGIADTDCLEDGTWRISYSDGTTQIARGPCRVVVVPTEKPEN